MKRKKSRNNEVGKQRKYNIILLLCDDDDTARNGNLEIAGKTRECSI